MNNFTSSSFKNIQGSAAHVHLISHCHVPQSTYCIASALLSSVPLDLWCDFICPGILGDPQFFVLESRDDDRETRVFDPVIFSLPGSGQVDLVTNAMDQGNIRNIVYFDCIPSQSDKSRLAVLAER